MPSGVAAIFLSAFAFSVMTLFVKLAGERIPSQEIVLARSLVSVALSFLLLRRAGVSPWGHDRRGLWLRGLTGYFALSCVYAAVTHLPLADATVIHYLNPAFTALLAHHVGRQVLAPHRIDRGDRDQIAQETNARRQAAHGAPGAQARGETPR